MFMLSPYERRKNAMFEDFFDDFDKYFPDFSAAKSIPDAKLFKTDIRDTGDSYEMEAELPGYSREDITVDVEDNYLVVGAEKKHANDEKDKNGKYIRRERYFGSYKRSFNLEGIDAEAISAKFDNGVLTLTLPKATPSPKGARRLEIQ